MRLNIVSLLTAAACISSASAVPTTYESRQTATCAIRHTYTVVAGDGLAAIASSFGVTVAQIVFVNRQITNPRFIAIGETIKIPDASCVAPDLPVETDPTATCVVGTDSTYKVVAGDTLTIIAKEKLGITLQALVDANPQITNIDLIQIDQEINVPLCRAASKKVRTSDPVQRRKTIVMRGFYNSHNGSSTPQDIADLDNLTFAAKL